jgi:hypothetical protein
LAHLETTKTIENKRRFKVLIAEKIKAGNFTEIHFWAFPVCVRTGIPEISGDVIIYTVG